VQGYYYAEKYNGTIGNTQKNCSHHDFVNAGWACFAIGIRLPDSGIYQPLPMRGYKTEIMLGAGMNAATDLCQDIDQLYVQHVNTDTRQTVLGTFKPILLPTPNGMYNGSLHSMCPFINTGDGLGCTPAMFQWDKNTYQTAWQSACAKAKQDGFMEPFYVDGQSNAMQGVFVPLQEEDATVDLLTGRVRHTILIVHSKSKVFHEQKAPLIRVRVDAQDAVDASEYTFGAFTPIGQTLIREVKQQTTYGMHLPVFGSSNANLVANSVVPEKYKFIYFRKWYQLVISFFVIPLVISLYYAVTDMQFFKRSPYLILALAVRLPLSAVGLMLGCGFYFGACLVHGLAYFSRKSLFSYTNGKYVRRKEANELQKASSWNWNEVCFQCLMCISFVLYVLHLVNWMKLFNEKKDFLSFSLAYNALGDMQYFGLLPVHVKLISNFFAWFLLLDTFSSCILVGSRFVSTLLMFAGGVCMMK
jgi:hypothetical protein